MREFLVEVYVSRSEPTAVEAGAERAHRAATELRAEGQSVRYLQSLFLPDDETCFYLYEADSVEEVRAAAIRADLPNERIVAAVMSSATTTR